MKRFVTFCVSTISFLTGTILVGLFSFAWFYRDIPAPVLEERYGSESSQYLNIDGVRFHYMDEGPRDGPTVLLIHAHWSSLIMWDAWADALSDKYRVLRFDMAGHGLTGEDPSGDYTLQRGVFLLEKFLEALNVSKFDIAGTSLGGTHAIHYTAKHPDNIGRLILLNPGALNAGVRGRNTPRALPWWIDIMGVITPKTFFQFMLSSGYGDPQKLDNTVVTRWHDLQLREGQRKAELSRNRQYVSGDIEGKIRSLVTPTLIIWGEANPVVTVDQAHEFMSLLESSADKNLIIYPGLGHMAALEDPQTTSRDIRDYLDGTYKF